MSTPLLVSNFMWSLSQRVKELAIPELFGGNPGQANNRLALDHQIPITLANQSHYEIRLLAYVRHVKDDSYYSKIIPVALTYSSDCILAGPNNWQSYIDSFAYQLVSSLRLSISKLQNPTYLVLNQGDIGGMKPHMRRIWIT